MSLMNWSQAKAYEDITFNTCNGVARIAFNRPEVRNAFRPKTVDEMLDALIICHESQEIGVVLISGEGPSKKDGGWAFCSTIVGMSIAKRASDKLGPIFSIIAAIILQSLAVKFLLEGL